MLVYLRRRSLLTSWIFKLKKIDKNNEKLTEVNKNACALSAAAAFLCSLLVDRVDDELLNKNGWSPLCNLFPERLFSGCIHQIFLYSLELLLFIFCSFLLDCLIAHNRQGMNESIAYHSNSYLTVFLIGSCDRSPPIDDFKSLN